jgi:hypothetical protein
VSVKAVLQLRVNGRRDEAVQHERLEHVAPTVGVRALLIVHQLHLQPVSTEITPYIRCAAFSPPRFLSWLEGRLRTGGRP